MQPAVTSSTGAPKFVRSAVFNIVLLVMLMTFIGLLVLTGDPGAIVFVLIVDGLLAWAVVGWIRGIRRAKGELPVLVAQATDLGLRLKRKQRGAWSSSGGGKDAVIAPGVAVTITEKAPDSSMDFLIGARPFEYFISSPERTMTFYSFARLVAQDLEPLRALLEAQGSTLTAFLERSAADGPIVMEPVGPGAPREVRLAFPGGAAMLGVYDGSGSPGGIPADHAYNNGARLALGTHLPVTLRFDTQALNPAGWRQLPTTALQGTANTVVIASQSGVVQVVATVPAGIRAVYAFVAAYPEGLTVYLHLDTGTQPGA